MTPFFGIRDMLQTQFPRRKSALLNQANQMMDVLYFNIVKLFMRSCLFYEHHIQIIYLIAIIISTQFIHLSQ